MKGRRTFWARYFTPSLAQRDLGLYCLGAGWASAALPITDRTLDCYAAVLIRSGDGTFRAGTKAGTHRISAGTLFWLYPGVRHTYTPGPSGWSEQWVLFSGLAARSYETLGIFGRAAPVQALTRPEVVTGLFDGLIEVCNQDHPRHQTEAAVLVHQLIIEASRQHPDQTGVGRGCSSVVSRLQDHACGSESLVQHARRLGLTVPALRDAVRRESGTTPKELILQTRLGRAQELLASTDLSVQYIAREVGYDDPSYFSRLFKGRVGISPRVFRLNQARTTNQQKS